MPRNVILVGHCGADASYLRIAVRNALPDAVVSAADEEAELQQALESGADLLLVNRVLDYGFPQTNGIDLIRRLRASHPAARAMLVSNYPDAQAEATAAGALPGFGKKDLRKPEAGERLRAAFAAEEMGRKSA